MFVLRITLLFIAVSVTVYGDDSFTLLQKSCKTQQDAVREKENEKKDICPDFKKLVACIASVNTTAVDSFLNSQTNNCQFTDAEIKNLQKSKNPTTMMTETTEQSNSSAGPTLMKTLLAIVFILQVLFNA